MKNIFVTGTDTGIGKTVISLLIMRVLYTKGYSPFYYKPFQTGCLDVYDTDSDAKFVYSYIDELKDKDPEISVGCCLPNPKAPYFAARDANTVINIQKVIESCQPGNPVVYEGAGGLMVPIDEKHNTIDLIKLTNSQPVLVARASLGTINHTLLSIQALRNNQIEPASIIFVNNTNNGTSHEMIKENMEAIKKFSGIKVAGIITPIKDFSNPEAENLKIIEKVISKIKS